MDLCTSVTQQQHQRTDGHKCHLNSVVIFDQDVNKKRSHTRIKSARLLNKAEMTVTQIHLYTVCLFHNANDADTNVQGDSNMATTGNTEITNSCTVLDNC